MRRFRVLMLALCMPLLTSCAGSPTGGAADAREVAGETAKAGDASGEASKAGETAGAAASTGDASDKTVNDGNAAGNDGKQASDAGSAGAGAAAYSDVAPTWTGFRPVGDETLMMDPSLWGELNTHDPSIVKDGDTYYVFSTDASYGDVHKAGVQIRKSKDLVTWQYVGAAFDDFAVECAEAVEHAKLDVSKNQGLWAPDVVKAGDVWRMYFSASTFGSSRSCIGMAESADIEGPYRFRGIVVESEANAVTGPNCIDPAFIEAQDGSVWMSYGSFSGGIFIDEIDPVSGFLKEDDVKPVRIAGSRGASIEGSYIVRMPESGYFYLFVSYGSLSSDYNIRVGRSKAPTGPYLDANGKDLATLGAGNEESVGTKIIGGYSFLSDPGPTQTKGYMAPGHNSVLVDDGEMFLVHHVRTYRLPDYWFTMNVRRMVLNRFGWPVVAPQRYAGESLGDASLPDGEYGLVRHLADSSAKGCDSEKISLAGGKVSGAATGTYEISDGFRISLTIDGVAYDGVVLDGFDGERQRKVSTFTAMSETGLCVWGSTQLK